MMPNNFIRAGMGAVIAFACLCASAAVAANPPSKNTDKQHAIDPIALLNRITWGVDPSTVSSFSRVGASRFLDQQLHPVADPVLPASVQAQIDALTISQRPMAELVLELENRRKDIEAIKDDTEKKTAQHDYQSELNQLANEAASRALLRALYSPNQLQEQMTQFWMNHFNIYQSKSNIRAMIGDFEEHAIRPHALGHFRDLLAATLRHPAMLRYLDNDQNALGHINENYARELMELHTLGVEGGYSQNDVQELARILTGLGVNVTDRTPNIRKDLQSQYVRDGLFEFNPNRHDYGDKVFLGEPIVGRGLPEVEEVIDRISRHPATAHFISNQLAIYFVADNPSRLLVDKMARAFTQSDGDIAATLRIMFQSREFARSLSGKFKDPLHYVISAVRLAYPDKLILNTAPMINWLNRMNEPLYGKQTPDGYSLTEEGWASAGQMSTRFEIARVIGSNSAGLFKTNDAQPVEQAAFPQLANALYFKYLQDGLSAETRQALDQANSAQEWNTFFLSSPEFMHR